ncbi:hypothetical protein AB0B79_25790 [Streptomyces sp. NPDC039022]|uniref:hypothetical protein n=1 Tax=Streptomyces sp. NPDC039022 TaxID=3157091 RepID=UPI0033E35657
MRPTFVGLSERGHGLGLEVCAGRVEGPLRVAVALGCEFEGVSIHGGILRHHLAAKQVGQLG